MIAGLPEVVDHLVELHADLKRKELLEASSGEAMSISEHPLGISETDAARVLQRAVEVMQEMYGSEFDKEMLLNPDRSERWLSPRIELRRVAGRIAQIVISFKNTEDRDQSLGKIMEGGQNAFTYLAAGTKTIEVQTAGMNKAVPIGFIENHFDEVLDEMGYSVTSDNPINARETKTIVIADADGTIYSRPTYVSGTPISNLSTSVVREPLIDYLEAGGLFAVNSGYQLEKIRQRILAGIPDDKRHLLSRIIIIASAGATLNVFNPDGSLRELPSYQNALREHSPGPVSKLDVIYFGDDEKREGNDYAAFHKVGFERAVSVSDESTVPHELLRNHVGNLEMGTAEMLKAIVQKTRASPGQPLFTQQNISEFVQNAKRNLLPKQISATAEAILKNELLGKDFVANALEMRSIMNPLDEDVTIVYGAGGPDVSTAYLSTGFKKAYFLDIYQMTKSRLQGALDRWDVNGMALENLDEYKRSKVNGGITVSGRMSERYTPEFFLIQELKAMGVRKEDIHVGLDEKNRPKLAFKLSQDEREREIIFVQRNILAMKDHFKQPELDAELKDSVDIYFQKALFVGDLGFDRYIGDVSSWIRPGGFMAVDPFTSDGEFHDPFPHLQKGLYRNRVTDGLAKVRKTLYTSEDRLGWVYGYGWDLMVLEKNKTLTRDDSSFTETRNVDFGKEQEKEILADIFAHQYGISLGPTLVALNHMGIMDMLKPGGFVSMKEILEKTGGSPGYLHVALRLLASAGLTVREGRAGTHDLKYRLTEEGRMALDVIPQFEKISQFMPTAIRLNEMTSRHRISDFETGKKIFRELIELSSYDWEIPPESDAKRMAMRKEMIHYLNGLLIGPAMAALGINQIFKDRKVFNPYEMGEGNWELYQMIFDLLVQQGWMKKQGSDYVLTEYGVFAASRAPAYGVTVSYLPLFSRVEELLKGAKFDEIFARDKQGHETHVDREMNVWGSGGAHKTYFKKIDEIVVEIFNRPIEEQPEGIADMGCGDGTFLKHLYEVVRTKTERGKMLDKYPLKIIGADYNEAAREATRKTLQAAGIPQSHIVFGDINDPEGRRQGPNGETGFAKALEGMGINPKNLLHVRSFLDHNRPYEPPEGDYSQRVSESTGAFAYKGEIVTPEALEQNLVEHFQRWAPYVERFGLLVLELHSIPPELAARSKGKTLATPYDGTHGYSDQYTIEVPSFVKAAREAGLEPVQEYEAKFPPNDLATVTINVFKVKKKENAVIEQEILDYQQIDVPDEYGALAGEHAVSRGWVDLVSSPGGLYADKEKRWLDEAVKALPKDRPAKILFVGAGRGAAILGVLQNEKDREFEIHTINKESNLLYDLPHLIEYLDPTIYLNTTFEELAAKNDPIIAQGVELYRQLHAHPHVMDISDGRGLESLDKDFDLVVIGNLVLDYVPGQLRVNKLLYERLREQGKLFTEVSLVQQTSRDSYHSRTIDEVAKEIGRALGCSPVVIRHEGHRDAASMMFTRKSNQREKLHSAVQGILALEGQEVEEFLRKGLSPDILYPVRLNWHEFSQADKAALFEFFLGISRDSDGRLMAAMQYEFEDMIGAGRQGVVFKVKDVQTGKSWALKLSLRIPEGLSAQEASNAKEFARLYGKKEIHPNVLSTKTAGSVRGKDRIKRLYILSEYLDIREFIDFQNIDIRNYTYGSAAHLSLLTQILAGLDYLLKHGFLQLDPQIALTGDEVSMRSVIMDFEETKRSPDGSFDAKNVSEFQSQWASMFMLIFEIILEKQKQRPFDRQEIFRILVDLDSLQAVLGDAQVKILSPLFSFIRGFLSYLLGDNSEAQKYFSAFEATDAFSRELYDVYSVFRKLRGNIAVMSLTPLEIAQSIVGKLGDNALQTHPVELIDKIGKILTEDYPVLMNAENGDLRGRVVAAVIENVNKPEKTVQLLSAAFKEKLIPVLKQMGIPEQIIMILDKIVGTRTFYSVLNTIFRTGNLYSNPALHEIVFEVHVSDFVNGYLTETNAKQIEDVISTEFRASFEKQFGLPCNAYHMAVEYAKAVFFGRSETVGLFSDYETDLEGLFMAEGMDELFLNAVAASHVPKRLERIGAVLASRTQAKPSSEELTLQRELMRLLITRSGLKVLDGGKTGAFDQAA